MLTILGLGFLIGVRHAFEADHAAAVATLTTRSQSVAHTIRQGIVWGFGHTLTLLLCSSLVLLLGVGMPERLAQGLEFLVGCMLVGLGMDVARRMFKERIHIHVHQHPNQRPHIHLHSHKGEGEHTQSTHDHEHQKGFPYRALYIGFMHGMAGSAALIILTLQTSLTPLLGLVYIVVFGVGSMVGMAAISFAIALPLRYATTSLTWAYNGLKGCIAILTITLGLTIIYSTAHALPF